MFIAVPRWTENNYIFASTHNFAEIIKSAIISTDRVNWYDNDTNSAELFVCKTPYLKRLLKFQRAAEKWKKLIEKEYNKLLKLDQELNACFVLKMEIWVRYWVKLKSYRQQTDRRHREHFILVWLKLLLPPMLLLTAVSHCLQVLARTCLVMFVASFHR